MQCVREVKDVETGRIVEYLANHPMPFKKSQLYASASDTKLVDESESLSHVCV